MTANTLPYGLSEFVQGATTYLDYYPKDNLVRMVLILYIADLASPIRFIVDTGAPWCVLNPTIFEKVATQAEFVRFITPPLNIRGLNYTGSLYRIPIHLDATLGEALSVEATVFVPHLNEDEMWLYPNFIGLQGFLDRIRFAVDPSSNLFFFGQLA